MCLPIILFVLIKSDIAQYRHIANALYIYMYVYRAFHNMRTNSDLCHLQHKLIGFYNRDEKCLQRGTDWGFK
jgi:hypothetical protein